MSWLPGRSMWYGIHDGQLGRLTPCRPSCVQPKVSLHSPHCLSTKHRSTAHSTPPLTRDYCERSYALCSPGNLFDITLSHRLSGFERALLGSKQKQKRHPSCAAVQTAVPTMLQFFRTHKEPGLSAYTKEDVKQMTSIPSLEATPCESEAAASTV